MQAGTGSPGLLSPVEYGCRLGGAVRIYIENDELRGIVKRFICGRGWRDCKAAEDTSGGSDRCGYFIRFHVSSFRLVVG